MVPLKRHSRIIFVAYIFSNLSIETPLANIVISLEDIYIDPVEYDQNFINELINVYDEYKSEIWIVMNHYTKATDPLIHCIIACGMTEMIYRYKKDQLDRKYKVILSECLYISDLFETPSNIINAVLHKFYENGNYKNN